jgi:hypothetical protein
MIEKPAAVVDRPEMMVRIDFFHEFNIAIPLVNGLVLKKIVLIGKRPPNISERAQSGNQIG